MLSKDWAVSSGGIAWSSNDEEVWFTAESRAATTNQALYAATLSGETREVANGPGELRLLDVAPDGRALMARWDRRVGIRAFGWEATSQRDLSWFDKGFLLDLSPEGRTIVFHDIDATFLRRTDGSPPIRLGDGYTFDLGRLSPDGKWVVTASASGPRTPVLIPTGAGETRRLQAAPTCDSAEWFPDGKRILCGNAKSGVFSVEVATGKASKLPLPADTPLFSQSQMLSRDGNRIAVIEANGDVRVFCSPTAAQCSGFRRRPPGIPRSDGPRTVGTCICTASERCRARIQRLDLDSGKMELWRELSRRMRPG